VITLGNIRTAAGHYRVSVIVEHVDMNGEIAPDPVVEPVFQSDNMDYALSVVEFVKKMIPKFAPWLEQAERAKNGNSLTRSRWATRR